MNTADARFATLKEWLDWQETLHPSRIDLGLERVRTVLQRMSIEHPSYRIVMVGGTNGKGSSVAMLESILRAAGYRVGAYTSPHVLRYNERVRIDGREANDTQLCEAFERIDQAREDISLTYFEFGTLAAFDIFQHSAINTGDTGIDIALLEVGMGGRLDAVNVLDGDIAIVTSVGIDHVAWLGEDRETIGWEKAGIFRQDRPVVCGDARPPGTLVRHARQLGSPLYRIRCEYGYETNDDGSWSWWGTGQQVYDGLPMPSLYGPYQLRNAAGVIMALELLRPRIAVDRSAIAAGFESATLAGRFQVIALARDITCILDVAHNPQAAQALSQALALHPCHGRTHVVMGMLVDKDIAGVMRELLETVDSWHLAGLAVERGATAGELAQALASSGEGLTERQYPDVAAAFTGARAMAQPGDRIVVCGSFYTVTGVLKALDHERSGIE